MKLLQSSIMRAVCAVITGALIVKYREQTVTWLTIAIGVLFLLSGIVSCAAYIAARKRHTDVQVLDVSGRQITGVRPSFPIVGAGSVILGLILMLMPGTFTTWLMYILAIILILGAINQFVALAVAARIAHVGAFFWIMPSIVLLVGIIALVRPSAVASAPLLIIGWCMIVYGVVECINTLKIHRARKAAQRAVQAAEAEEVKEMAEEETES